jgi:hypothetical protein
VTSVAVWSAPLMGGPASLILDMSGSSITDVYQGIAQIGVTSTTVFVGGFSSVE